MTPATPNTIGFMVIDFNLPVLICMTMYEKDIFIGAIVSFELILGIPHMTTKQINKYRVYCNTESQYVYDWNDKSPITCPNNSAHSIDATSSTIVDTVKSQSVNIIQEAGPTGGNYSCESYSFSIPPGQTVLQNYSWPFNISISSVHFTTDTSHVGDLITSIIAPGTTLGVTGAAVKAGDTKISVSPSVVQNIQKGMSVSLTDGTNVSNLAKVYLIDCVNNIIQCQTPSQFAYTSTGVAVQACFQNIRMQLGPPQSYVLGTNQIKSAFLPANTILNVQYVNQDPNNPKNFLFYLQYYY